MTVHLRYALYAPVLFAATGLLFLKSLIYAKLFSVESFGTLNQATVVASAFTSFGAAGLQLLGHKLLPQYYARGNAAFVDDLIASSFGVFGLTTVLAALTVAVAALAGWLQGSHVWLAALLLSAAQFLFVMRLIDIKSNLQFSHHARISALRALVVLALGAGVAMATRSVAATLAVEGLATFVFAVPLLTGLRGRSIVGKASNLGQERQWLTANLPGALRLLWLNGTVTVLYALDRWTGIALLSDREYGIFALGLLVVVVFETLQAVINVAAYPLMGRMIARGEHLRAFRLATLATAIIVSAVAAGYAPFVMLLEYLVQRHLPLYAEATSVIKLAVVAGALRLADFYASFAILCNEEERMSWAFGALVLAAVAVLALAQLGGYVVFNPERLTVVTVGISVCAFLLNLAVAIRARAGLIGATRTA